MREKINWVLGVGLAAAIAVVVFTGILSPTTQAGPPASPYVFGTTSTNSGERVIIRVNTRTGESWVNSTINPPEWGKIQEEKPVADGDYDVYIQHCRDVKDSFFATRVDKRSGKAWHYGDKWVEFKEPKP